MGGIILGSILWILLTECNWIQDFHGWYHPWNNLIEVVSWVQMDTGLTTVVTSLELFDV
jgi:hypothetical protein